jgi:hypothetical protein
VSQFLVKAAIHAQETQEKTISRRGRKKLAAIAENHLSALPEEEQIPALHPLPALASSISANLDLKSPK